MQNMSESLTSRSQSSSKRSNSTNNPQNKSLLERKILLSRFVIAIEYLWPRLWLPVGVVALFILTSLTGVWEHLPLIVHQILLGCFGLAFLASFIPILRMPWPTRQSAMRRLEEKAKLPHRPLSSYDDTLIVTSHNNATEKLWNAHKNRIAALFKKMRSGWPHPRVDQYDPYALRTALTLVIATTLIAFGTNTIYERVATAFDFSSSPTYSTARLDAWITPPVYTRKAPIMLANGANTHTRDLKTIKPAETMTVPENSELIIRLNGENTSGYKVKLVSDDTTEVLKEHTHNETSAQEASNASPLDASTEARVTAQNDLEIREYKVNLKTPVSIEIQNGSRVTHNWQFNILEDTPPTIKLTEPVSTTARGALSLKYQVQDDYGVSSAKAFFEVPDEIALTQDASSQTQPEGNTDHSQTLDKKQNKQTTLDANDPDRPLGTAPNFALKLKKTNAKITQSQVFRNLSSHPWAGLTVDMTLKAWDQAKQVGQTAPIKLKLPSRKFQKPLAKAIIEQRLKLVARPKSHRIPVMKALHALTIAPELFAKDKSVYLGLRSAFWRMNYKTDRDTIESVVEQLWQIALRIEDGDLSDAEKALRQAQEELAKALENGASEEEIKRLLSNLRQAVNEFLQALAKQNQNAQSPLLSQNGQNQNRMISPQDLDNMLKNIENLAKSGARDMANQMLSQLQNMLENLQAGNQQQNQSSQNMMSMMENLGDLIMRQQQLLDQTYQSQRQAEEDWQNAQQGQQGQNQRGQPRPGQQQGQRQGQGPGQQSQQGQQGEGQRGQGQRGSLSQQQQALRNLLNQLAEQMQQNGMQPSQQLGRAGQAMGDAGNALEGQNYDRATQEQTLALDQLRKGAQQMAQQMMQQLGQRMGRNNQDPLGRTRRTSGPDFGGDVKVPDEIDIQRAREILQELRKRFSEPGRPSIELDYLERLLKRF